jgi:hypothetical protein
MYNNWNFTGNYLWDSISKDSFWYSMDSNLMYYTPHFEIGKENPAQIDIDIQPIKYIHL